MKLFSIPVYTKYLFYVVIYGVTRKTISCNRDGIASDPNEICDNTINNNVSFKMDIGLGLGSRMKYSPFILLLTYHKQKQKTDTCLHSETKTYAQTDRK